MAYDRITLNNGLRIIGERMEAVHTVAVGVFVRTGAVNEAPAENGYSHFVEHMVFKGTKDRDAAALADEMDRLGGATNAFTTKESTCFYTKVLQEDLGRGIRLLQDLILHPEFPGEDLERVEQAEDALFALGFTDFRVRLLAGAARIQLPEDQWDKAAGQRKEILAALNPWFSAVTLDLETR